MKPPILPPPLSVVKDEIPKPSGYLVTENPEPPSENIRPIPTKDKEYIATQDVDGDWFLVASENSILRHLTETEAKQVASIMNEQGSNVITLYCRNDKCKYKGSWIRRSSDDVKKNVYHCEMCKTPMLR